MKQVKIFCDICGEELHDDDFKKEGEVSIERHSRIIITPTDSLSPVRESIFIDSVGSSDYETHICYRCLLGTALFLTGEKKTDLAKFIHSSIEKALSKYNREHSILNKDG